MGLDRLDFRNTRVTSHAELTDSTRSFLEHIEVSTCIPVEFIGTGFGTFDVIRSKTHALKAVENA
jgi:adenylosuccinate synthase